MSVDTRSGNTLRVLPRGEADGFQATVRGYVFELHDPSSYALSPTTDDLFVVSLAADLAWSARSFLRAHGLPEYVSVAARWETDGEPPGPSEIDLTVTVLRRAEAASADLAAAFENSLARRVLPGTAVHIAYEAA